MKFSGHIIQLHDYKGTQCDAVPPSSHEKSWGNDDFTDGVGHQSEDSAGSAAAVGPAVGLVVVGQTGPRRSILAARPPFSQPLGGPTRTSPSDHHFLQLRPTLSGVRPRTFFPLKLVPTRTRSIYAECEGVRSLYNISSFFPFFSRLERKVYVLQVKKNEK